MAFRDRIKKPMVIYALLANLLLTEQFDRNLDLKAVEKGTIRNFLETSNSCLEVLANHIHPVGAIFYVYKYPDCL